MGLQSIIAANVFTSPYLSVEYNLKYLDNNQSWDNLGHSESFLPQNTLIYGISLYHRHSRDY